MTQRTLRFGSLATLLAIALLVGAHPAAQTQPVDHSIVVTLDETSIGDLMILERALQDGLDGEEVSPALRKVALSAVGETWVTLESRLDESGTLTLEDGSTIAVLPEEDIVVQAKGKKFQPGATIVFTTVCSKLTGQCHRVPSRITVVRGDGTRMCSSFPPRHLGQLTDGKCTVKPPTK